MGWNNDGTVSNKASYDQDRFLFVCDAVGDCEECDFAKIGYWHEPPTPCVYKKQGGDFNQCFNPIAQLEAVAPNAAKRIL